MQEEDIERKQRFLREEIIDKGFDADEFTLWIDEGKEKGTLRVKRLRTRRLEFAGTRRCRERVPNHPRVKAGPQEINLARKPRKV
jgi:hypothetical protein